MKPLCVTIQMKAIEQYFHVVLFIMLYTVFPTFKSVDKALVCGAVASYGSFTFPLIRLEWYSHVWLRISPHLCVPHSERKQTLAQAWFSPVCLFLLNFLSPLVSRLDPVKIEVNYKHLLTHCRFEERFDSFSFLWFSIVYLIKFMAHDANSQSA